jgi:hypothetical protein
MIRALLFTCAFLIQQVCAMESALRFNDLEHIQEYSKENHNKAILCFHYYPNGAATVNEFKRQFGELKKIFNDEIVFAYVAESNSLPFVEFLIYHAGKLVNGIDFYKYGNLGANTTALKDQVQDIIVALKTSQDQKEQ